MSDSVVYLDRPGVLVMPGGQRAKSGGTRIPISAGRIVEESMSIEALGSINYELELALFPGDENPIMCSEEPTKMLVLEILRGTELNESSRVLDTSSIRKWSLRVEHEAAFSMRLSISSNRQPETYSSYLQRRLKE